MGGGEVVGVEGAVEARGHRVDGVGQVRVEGLALGRELGGAGTVGVAAAGDQPLRFEFAEQGGDARQAEVELRLAGEVEVEVAGLRHRAADGQDAQDDVLAAGDAAVGGGEEAVEQGGDGALGFADVLAGEGCWL